MGVSMQYLHSFATMEGYFIRMFRLTITGLTQGADNVVAHGLPAGPNPPRGISYRPQADGGWHEYQQPDATNFYIHVDAGGPTSFIVEAGHPA